MEEEKKLKILPNKQMQELHDVSPVDEFYSSLKDVIDIKNRKSPYGDFLLNSVENGDKKFYFTNSKETKVFKVNYIDVLETGYEHISRIIKNPKSGIKYLQEVVNVEKAKKINSDTVRHLASHTQYIREIQDDGFVIPSKLLTTFAEEDNAIYENRFLKTLLNRIDTFLKIRYDIIKDNMESYQQDRLRIEDNFEVHGNKVDFKMEIGVRRDIPENVIEAKKSFAKISHLRDLFRGLKSSPFIRELQKARDVRAPIMKTNIILHNADFIVCYNLWMFLDRYVSQDYDVDIQEIEKPFTPDFSNEINNIETYMVANMLYYNDLTKFDIKNINITNKLKTAPVRLSEPKYNIVLEPESIKLEDNEPKEYFLENTRQYYQSKKEIIDDENPEAVENLNFTKVYKDILKSISSISEQLYIPESEDYDEDLPVEEQLENATRRLRVTHLTNRLKKEDLTRTVKLEARYKKSLEKLKAEYEQQKKIEAREKAREIARQKAEDLRQKRAKEKEARLNELRLREAEREAAKELAARKIREAIREKELEEERKALIKLELEKQAEQDLKDKEKNALLAKEIYDSSLEGKTEIIDDSKTVDEQLANKLENEEVINQKDTTDRNTKETKVKKNEEK